MTPLPISACCSLYFLVLRNESTHALPYACCWNVWQTKQIASNVHGGVLQSDSAIAAFLPHYLGRQQSCLQISVELRLLELELARFCKQE